MTELKLIDGTWLEGTDIKHFMPIQGIWLTNVFFSTKTASTPLAENVFIPYTSILFLIPDSDSKQKSKESKNDCR